ncbi:ABC transporter ATP-binding protein [Clostridium sp. C8-1-8]|uniref:ABC transporter ATP-binding protein n=1 Tax=Clostridium sp. C8-1-8 TaxID=2698831 RepID=UPI0013712214|nr:ABC transporter ATP-binding protein [Clostridium sp. C8-1-8]
MLQVKNLCKSFMTGETVQEVLKNVNLTVKDGDFITIMGASGGGKSTLLHLIALLDTPSSGEIYLDGRRVDCLKESYIEDLRGKNIGLIFQNANLISSLNPLENLIIAMKDSKSKFKTKKKSAEQLLSRVGLSEKKDAKTSALSGGEAQRVAVVRALVNNPSIILCDEPTGALDSSNGEKVISLLLELRKETGCSLIIVTHDERIGVLGERRCFLKDGVLNEVD